MDMFDERLEQLLTEESPVEETQEEAVSESNLGTSEDEADSNVETSTEEVVEESSDDIPYTAGEIKRLGMDKLDPNKLPPELVPYYRSMQSDYTRKMQRIAERDAELRAQVAQEPPAPSAPDQKQFVAALSTAAKAKACSMLGISPEVFDEFDPQHHTAFSVATVEIQRQLQAMQQERLGQDRVKNVFQSVVSEYATTEPNFDRINAWVDEWAETLPVTKYNQLISDVQSGDPGMVRAAVETARKAWYDAHRPAKKATPPKVVSPGMSSPTPKRQSLSGKEFANLSEEDQLNALTTLLEE